MIGRIGIRLAKLCVLMAGVALGCGQALAQAKPEFKTVEPGYLTIAIYGHLLPSIGRTSDGLPDGIQGMVLRKVAEKHGLKPKLFETNFTGAITAVQSGRADVGTGTYWTPDRSKVLYLTDATHLNYLFWAVKKTMPYENANSLKGKIVGSATGYAHNKYFKEAFGDNFREFPGDAQGIQAVANGQIDAYNSGIAMVHRARDIPDLKIVNLAKGEFGIPDDVFVNPVRMYVGCDNKKLGETVNAVLAGMRSDGSLMSTIKNFYTGTVDIISPQNIPQDNCGK